MYSAVLPSKHAVLSILPFLPDYFSNLDCLLFGIRASVLAGHYYNWSTY